VTQTLQVTDQEEILCLKLNLQELEDVMVVGIAVVKDVAAAVAAAVVVES
jgi:hypothetical protein